MTELFAASLLDELRALLGDGGVITDPGALLVYESDGLTAYRARPGMVVLPRSTAEAAAAVRALSSAGVPFVARGAGTGLSGGAVALGEAAVISLARLTRILKIDAVSRRARVEAGVVNARLARALTPLGLQFAPDPSSQAACTVGGNVAENAGGPHCLKYGATSQHVTGLKVVLAGGEVVELGGGPDPDGLDLVGLFVGSEGTFGLATEIEVRLTPLPEAVATLLAVFPSVDAATGAVTEILAAGLLPAALEVVDAESIVALRAAGYAGYPHDAGAVLVVELDGPAAGLEAETSRALACCESSGASAVKRARSASERQALWEGRKKIYGALGRLAPDVMVQDAVVPRSRMSDVLRKLYGIAAKHQIRMAAAFHAGDGNLHPGILFDRRDPEQVLRVERATKEMMQVCIEAGGTLTGEHGVGLDKRDSMPLVFGDPELEAMAAVRRVFDPRGLANPGKVLPVRFCREWSGALTHIIEERH
jgi:glycolate oxidase subunit GlcD